MDNQAPRLWAYAISCLGFYAAVEHATEDVDGGGCGSEVVFLFDATLTDSGHFARPESRRHPWVDERDLSAVTLRPSAVKDRLLQAPRFPGRQWCAWTP